MVILTSSEFSSQKVKKDLRFLISFEFPKTIFSERVLLKEFKLSISDGYKKYDAWTQILENNIIGRCIKNFSEYEKKNYYDIYHTKIRNITRFTYPETIAARDKLLKLKILRTKKEVVRKVDTSRNKLIVETINTNNRLKKYICDLVINVSGPLNAETVKHEIPLIKSLKKCL